MKGEWKSESPKVDSDLIIKYSFEKFYIPKKTEAGLPEISGSPS